MARMILWCESNNTVIKMICIASHIKEILNISGLGKYASVYSSLKDALTDVTQIGGE